VQNGYQSLLFKGPKENIAYAVDLWPETHQIRIRVGSEFVSHSKSVILASRWTHIGLVFADTGLILYVNGVQDTYINVVDRLSNTPHVPTWFTSKDKLYIGSHPDPNVNGVHAFIDELQILDGVKSPEFINAISQIAQSGAVSTSTWLGCRDCNRADAASACKSAPIPRRVSNASGGAVPAAPAVSGHICTIRELSSGSLTLARTNGWFDAADTNVYVYSKESVEGDVKNGVDSGLGLCCSDQ
jgi:hypothetical protein